MGTTDEHFAEAAQAYADLVAAIRPDQWNGPGLGEWDLRALVGHQPIPGHRGDLPRPAGRE